MYAPSDSAAINSQRLAEIVSSSFMCLLLMAGVATADYSPSNKIFTYQGRLYDKGTPADGEYDLMFRLWEGPEPNKAHPVTWEEVYNEFPVSDGYLTVDLNFAPYVSFTQDDLFDGSGRWLRIGIRPGELKDPNDYDFLYPLTKLNAVPFAHLAHRLQTPALLRSDSNDPVLTIANAGAGHEINFEGESTHIRYDNDATIDILDDYAINIGNSQTRFVAFDSTENVGHDRTLTIERNESKNVGVNSETVILGQRTINIGAVETKSVGASSTTTVSINRSTSVGALDETIVGAVSSVSTGTNMNRSAGKDFNLYAARDIKLAADELVLVQGRVVVSNDPNDLLKIDGAISMQPVDPNLPLTLGYGKLFVDKSDDKLYFLDPNGNLYDLTAVKSDRVSFSVKRDASYNWPAGSTFQTIDFSTDTTIWDNTGNAFKDKTAAFVAPDDGIYTFHGVICFASMVKGDIIGAAVSVDGRRYRGDMKTASGDNESVRVDITVYLSKDQQVKLEGYVSTTTPPVTVYGTGSHTEAFTYFNGAKVD